MLAVVRGLPEQFPFSPMRHIKQLIRVLATGYILVFYSESVFWARVRPEDSWPAWLATWLVYSVLGFVLLTCISRFRVQSIWALFLCGAVFGWLTEGLVVQTTYEALPLSISFTALAWHALISVWVGWYAVRRALHTSARATLLVACLAGLSYGFWAIAWWVEPDGAITPPSEFARFAALTTLLLIPAYWLDDRMSAAVFAPNRAAEIVVAVLLALQFVITTVPNAPIAIGILPVLLAVMYGALRRNQQAGSPTSLLQTPHPRAPVLNYLGLLLMPIMATTFYSVAFASGWRWHTNWVVYLVTTPMGFIVLAVSLIKVWRTPPVTSPAGELQR